MSTINRIAATGENGHGFVLKTHGLTPFGELRISLDFDLQWAKGSFESITSENRIHEFMRAIVAMNGGNAGSFSFMNDEGNLEITVKPTGRGDAIMEIIAIPNMAKDDRVEFEVEGTISCSK